MLAIGVFKLFVQPFGAHHQSRLWIAFQSFCESLRTNFSLTHLDARTASAWAILVRNHWRQLFCKLIGPFRVSIYFSASLAMKVFQLWPKGWSKIIRFAASIWPRTVDDTVATAFVLCSALPNNLNPSISSLDLGWNSLGDAGLRALAIGIQDHPSLTNLSLECNRISSEGAQALSHALQRNRSLTQINLAKNELGDAGVKELFHLFCGSSS